MVVIKWQLLIYDKYIINRFVEEWLYQMKNALIIFLHHAWSYYAVNESKIYITAC